VTVGAALPKDGRSEQEITAELNRMSAAGQINITSGSI
jgi:hypothetical protein